VSRYEWVEPMPFTNDAAAEAAEIYVELRAEGEIINRSDIYIAGTARSLSVPLVSGGGHFGAIDGLEVEVYGQDGR
jgi:predicted nucleic acid-binding protein